MAVIGYTRLSQGERDALGLEDQRTAILAHYRDAEIREEIKSGARADNRQILRELRRQLGRGDTLVVTRLDRLTRSLLDFARITEEARKQGWNLIVLEQGFDMATPHGKAMAGMLAVFAEFERDMIGQRTKAALAVARERGWNPRVIPTRTRRRIVRAWQEGATIAAVTRRVGLHRETVVRVLRQELEQPRGPLVRAA